MALALLATVPLWVGGTYYVNIASQILFYAIFALGVNVLAGYAGLVSLGHAGLFGIAAYAGAKIMNDGHGHVVVVAGALALTLLAAALFAVLALRGTGLAFVMITVALGQIVWGVAYRWISLTNGDNGIAIQGRPSPLGLTLMTPASFYWATLVVFLVAVASLAVFVASPFGASVRGTRDQPRRMNALGYHVWMIRFLSFLFSGFWSGVAGLLYLYYNQFVSPQAVALTASAEALLMVIAGGTADLARADRRGGARRRREERGERLHRALELPARSDLRRDRRLHARGAGAGHGAALAPGDGRAAAARYRGGLTGRRGVRGAARRPSRSSLGMSRLREPRTPLASSL